MAARKTAAAATPPAAPMAVKTSASAKTAKTPKTPKATKVARVPPAAKAAKPAKEDKAAAPPATGKTRLMRDSFTIPKDEYAAIDALKARALAAGRHVRKSELLRAGLQALSAMAPRSLLKALDAVPTLKTGRPKAEAGGPAAKKGAGRRKAA